jgi:5-methylcytosine-specific restriction endonuclease McrA
MPCPSLAGLSNRELLSRVKALVAKERATTLEILVHLNEVERRKLHLSLGYPSLFEYCTRYLGYSSSAAGRRIHAARCVRDFPEVYELLEKNAVTLVTISLVASILSESNKTEILDRIWYKSQREVETIAATYRPPVVFRDRARPVCVAVSEEDKPKANSGQRGPITPSAGSEKTPNLSDGQGDRLITHYEKRLLVQFLASEGFMKKFEEARALLSNRLPKASYEAVLEMALDEFLTRHKPDHKKARREQSRRAAKTRKAHRTSESTRHIPAAAKDAVYARDRGRCTYVGSAGERCTATEHLEIDHVVPYARGGPSTVNNLRLLCARHNKLEAERAYGANTISSRDRSGPKTPGEASNAPTRMAPRSRP